MIGPFRGKWAKLGNYSPCLIFMDGHAYNSLEHAYQAAKTTDETLRKAIRDQATPAQAKKLARSLPIRPDWDEVKLDVMYTLLVEKFAQEPERSTLLSTGDEDIAEVNWWNDRFWGQDYEGKGENHLGKLLMRVRQEIRDGKH